MDKVQMYFKKTNSNKKEEHVCSHDSFWKRKKKANEGSFLPLTFPKRGGGNHFKLLCVFGCNNIWTTHQIFLYSVKESPSVVHLFKKKNQMIKKLIIGFQFSSDDCLGSDNGLPTTPINGASSSSGLVLHHHHGGVGGNDLLNELKPNSFSLGNKILFDDGVHNSAAGSGSGLMVASRSMSSLMASQFGGGSKDPHASGLLHLPSTAFASYHPSGSHGYDGGSVATLANLHVAHQHVVQPSSLYHGHRDQAFSHA